MSRTQGSAANPFLRGCRDKNLRALVSDALAHPDLVKARTTKAGIFLVGPTGTATIHMTNSDTRRVFYNTRADLRSAGLYPLPPKEK